MEKTVTEHLVALDIEYIRSVCGPHIGHLCARLEGNNQPQTGFFGFRQGGIRYAVAIEIFSNGDRIRYANIALLRTPGDKHLGPYVVTSTNDTPPLFNKRVGQYFKQGTNISLHGDSIEVVHCVNRVALTDVDLRTASLNLVYHIFNSNWSRPRATNSETPRTASTEGLRQPSVFDNIKNVLLEFLSNHLSREALADRLARIESPHHFLVNLFRNSVTQFHLKHSSLASFTENVDRPDDWWVNKGLLATFVSEQEVISVHNLLLRYSRELKAGRPYRRALLPQLHAIHRLKAFERATEFSHETVPLHTAKYTLAFILLRDLGIPYDLDVLLRSRTIEAYNAELTKIRQLSFGNAMNPQWHMMEGLFQFYVHNNPSVSEEQLFERLPPWLRHMIAFSRIHSLSLLEARQLTREATDTVLGHYAQTFLEETYDDPEVVGKLIKAIPIEFHTAEFYFDHLIYLGLMKGPKIVIEPEPTVAWVPDRDEAEIQVHTALDTEEVLVEPEDEEAEVTSAEIEVAAESDPQEVLDKPNRFETRRRKRQKALRVGLGVATAVVLVGAAGIGLWKFKRGRARRDL